MTNEWTSPDGRIRLINADCLDILPTLESGSVDAVVTDPPYGQTNEDYDGASAISLRPDVWHLSRLSCSRAAALVAFTGSPNYHRIATAIEGGGWKVRQMWGWHFRDGMITSAWPKEGFDRLAPAFEPIAFATVGKVLLPLVREGGRAWSRPANSRGTPTYSERCSNHGATQAVGRWPRSVFEMPRTRGETAAIGHPNAKPMLVMEWLLEKLPGETILDPFAGSCTTAVACIRTNRRCIAIEKERKYFEIGIERCKAEYARTVLFNEAEAVA